VNIPKITKRFETSLASSLSAAGTTFTTVSATDDDGNALSGLYALSIDVGNADVEDIIATVSGTTWTIVYRGIDADAPNTEVAGNKKAHRRGAPVVITDYPIMGVLRNILNGDDTLPNKLSYASHPTFSSNTELIDKKYADDLAIAGAPDASAIVKGIFEEATQAEIDADTATGGTNARLAVNPATLATSKYGTQLPSSGQKSALSGTSGTPGGGNKYVTNDDTAVAATADKVARRNSTGDITVPTTPTANTDAASKSYADGKAPVYKTGQTSRASGSGTGTQNIAHGLGVTPKLVKITYTQITAGGSNPAAFCSGVGTCTSTSDESCTWTIGTDGVADLAGQTSGSIIRTANTIDTTSWAAEVSALDATNITLNFTVAGNNTIYIQWEAFA
jgi:hypothetical protein